MKIKLSLIFNFTSIRLAELMNWDSVKKATGSTWIAGNTEQSDFSVSVPTPSWGWPPSMFLDL